MTSPGYGNRATSGLVAGVHHPAPVHVRICFTSFRPKPADHETLFSDIFLPVHRGWPARLGSIAVHLLLVTIIPQLTLLLTPVPDFQLSRYVVQPINVRVPLYFAKISP